MYPRALEAPARQSFFLFGPRGVGKTAWLRTRFPDVPFFDLLFIYTGTRRWHEAGVDIVPADEALRTLGDLLR